MNDLYDENNVFFKIINGDLFCDKVYEDEKILAFYDINPLAPVHILVIPKSKFISFSDFIENSPSSYIEHFFSVIKLIITNNEKLQSGYRLITNSGSNGGQIVNHFHFHIIGGSTLGSMA